MDQPVQFADARDVAAWMLCMAERGQAGTYNVTSPRQRLTLGEFFAEANRVLGGRASFVPVAPAFLSERGVAPWTELPLWTAGDEGFVDIIADRAIDAGLAFHPLEATILDTRRWLEAAGGPPAGGTTVVSTPGRASLAPERERALLAQWRGATNPA